MELPLVGASGTFVPPLEAPGIGALVVNSSVGSAERFGQAGPVSKVNNNVRVASVWRANTRIVDGDRGGGACQVVRPVSRMISFVYCRYAWSE